MSSTGKYSMIITCPKLLHIAHSFGGRIIDCKRP